MAYLGTACTIKMSAANCAGGRHLELVEGDGRVVREQRRQFVQAGQHHKRHRVALRGQRDQLRAHRRHNTAVGQQRVRADQHLRAAG